MTSMASTLLLSMVAATLLLGAVGILSPPTGPGLPVTHVSSAPNVRGRDQGSHSSVQDLNSPYTTSAPTPRTSMRFYQPHAVPPNYSVTFVETGLTTGTLWGVTINQTLDTTEGNYVSLTLPNGTFNYTPLRLAGYSLTPLSGQLTVNGSSVLEVVVYTPTYTVTFAESGLPKGVRWVVNLGGSLRNSTSNSIAFPEIKGTYSYTVDYVPGEAADPNMGVITVAGSTAVAILFSPTTNHTYLFAIAETGLVTGTNWTATIGTTVYSTTHDYIQVELTNGTYGYSIHPPSNYVVRPSTGSIHIAGVGAIEAVTFLPTFTISFTETGLTSGTTWTLTLVGTSHSTTGASISQNEPDGTYEYEVSAPHGYQINATTGYVTVSNAPTVVVFTFTHPTHSTTLLGLPEDTFLAGFGVALLIIATTLIIVLLSRRKSARLKELGSPKPALVAPTAPSVSLGGPTEIAGKLPAADETPIVEHDPELDS